MLASAAGDEAGEAGGASTARACQEAAKGAYEQGRLLVGTRHDLQLVIVWPPNAVIVVVIVVTPGVIFSWEEVFRGRGRREGLFVCCW